MDEVTLSGNTHVTEVIGSDLQEHTWSPSSFGLEMQSKESMIVDGPSASANMIRDVLSGQIGPSRDIVVLNAAAALWVAGKHESTSQCAHLAAQAIDSGRANEVLARLVELSHRE